MLSENSKRIVVIRNIPSNLIEEAILILKSEPIHKDPQKNANVHRNTKKSDEFILKEAQMIINSFMKQNNLQAYDRRVIENKAVPKKNKYWKNTVINMFLVISLAILIFVITRAI